MPNSVFLLQGGKVDWDQKNEGIFACLRGNALFDSGAFANFVYRWFVDLLIKCMDIYVVEIDESVQFGGYQVAKLHEAIVLKISFRNPITGETTEREHVFRIIEEKKKPKIGPPIVIGLPTICSYYLDFFADLLRQQHKIMRNGLPLAISLEEELQRLHLKAVPKKILRREPVMMLIGEELQEDDDEESWGQLNEEEQTKIEVEVIDMLTAKQDEIWEEVVMEAAGAELTRESYSQNIRSFVSIQTKARASKHRKRSKGWSLHSRHNRPEKPKKLRKVKSEQEHKEAPQASNYHKESTYGTSGDISRHTSTLDQEVDEQVEASFTTKVDSSGKLLVFERIRNCDWTADHPVTSNKSAHFDAVREDYEDRNLSRKLRRKLKIPYNHASEPTYEGPYQGTILDVDMDGDQLLSFWEQDRQNKYWDIYLDKLSETGRQMTGFSKMARTKLDTSNKDDDEYDDYIRRLKSGEEALDPFTLMYMEQQKYGGLTIAQYIQWQEDQHLNHFNKIAYPVFLDFDANKYMEDTIQPWTHTLGESPEERDSYIPDGNTGIYNWLATTREEALDKYEKDARKNTTPEAWAEMGDIIMSDRCKRVFCPEEWTGMKNVEPIKLQFTDEWEEIKNKGMRPKGSKAFVNQHMREAYEKEFQRMKKYMYRDSKSSTSSRMLVADKATPPYVRICGDYRDVNKYIKIPQHYIPNIRHEIEKARGFKYYGNIDLANGYHNLPIDEEASEALALHTEFGLVEPKFCPEGVRSAPQEFQKMMKYVFKDMIDNNRAIVIWDNILVLANTLPELKERFNEIIDVCEHHNIILKMAKTEIGFSEASFFGYTVDATSVKLSQDRKDGIKALQFFKNKKGAQSFLGSCNFFKDFVPNYAMYAEKLQDMTKNDFSWDRSTWTIDYEREFEVLKEQIQGAMTLTYPDYNKLWIMRTDCSKHALGIVLFQVGEDGKYEPIAFHSQKLSEQAQNWAAVKLEAYAVYYGVRKLAYYLQGQPFVIEVDHANLVTMQNSEQAIIQRWRSYLENFNFRIKHIAGKQNLMADFQSRMYNHFPFIDEDDDTGLKQDVDIDDEYTQAHSQRCYRMDNLSSDLTQHRDTTSRNIFDLDEPPPKRMLQIHIRDPTTTHIVECYSTESMNTAFSLHDPIGLYSYTYNDFLIDGRDPISLFQSYGDQITIDAVSHSFQVSTRAKSKTIVPEQLQPVAPSRNAPETAYLEVECKFRMTTALQQRLDRDKVEHTTKTFTDIYFDTSDHTYTTRDVWIRQRGDKFELKYPAPSGHSGGIRSYLELTTDADILSFLKLVDHEHLPLTAVLRKHNFTAFSSITTTRTSYKMSLPVTKRKGSHEFKLDIDSAVLECNGATSSYDVAELELVTTTPAFSPVKAIHDIMDQLKIDKSCLEQSLNGKLVEALLRHDRPHYDALAKHGIVEAVPPNFSANGGKGQSEQQNTARIEVLEEFADINDADFGEDLAEHIRQTQAKVKAAMEELHGSRQLHYGADRMYKDACLRFPGHRIPQVYFKDYVAKCAGCQKSRLQKDKLFLEQVRTLKANAKPRSAVCIDRVTITPESANGFKTAIVIADLFTRLVRVYPVKEYDSASVADCLKDWIITYGAYDVVQSDPGSDILGGAVDAINHRWKMGRKVSLVDRHESNGNERLIQEILRHLRTLVDDDRAKHLWDTSDYIGFVTFCINNQVNRETGLAPFIATFGDRDEAFFSLPEVDQYAPSSAKEYVKKLNKSLELVRKLNSEYQMKIHEERIAKTPAETHNQFREGDLVWFRRKERIDKDGKLYSRNKGPYKVISMRRNDVKCEHIVNKQIKVFHVSDVMPVNLDTPFEELYEVAKRDSNEYEVLKVINFKGDPMKRGDELQFLMLFEGDVEPVWQKWSPDLMKNDKIQEFCEEHICLEVLLMTAAEAHKLVGKLRLEQISSCGITTGDVVYVDLKTWSMFDGGAWYESLELPQAYEKQYVVKGTYTKAKNGDKGRQIGIKFDVFNETQDQNLSFVKWYGSCKELTSDMILVDEDFILKYPQVVQGKSNVRGKKKVMEVLEGKKNFKVGSSVMRKRSLKNSKDEYEEFAYYGPLVVDKQEGRVVSYHLKDSHRHTGSVIDTELIEITKENENFFSRRQLSFDCKLNLCIKGYEGDPLKKKEMIFVVRFESDSKDEFMTYNFDLTEQEEFKKFCQSKNALWFIVRDEKESLAWQKNLDRNEIKRFDIGDDIYMDARALGNSSWYQGTNLPDYQIKLYIIKGKVKKFLDSKKKIQIQFDIYSDISTFGGYKIWIYAYSNTDIEKLEDCVIINQNNVSQYKGVL